MSLSNSYKAHENCHFPPEGTRGIVEGIYCSRHRMDLHIIEQEAARQVASRETQSKAYTTESRNLADDFVQSRPSSIAA